MNPDPNDRDLQQQLSDALDRKDADDALKAVESMEGTEAVYAFTRLPDDKQDQLTELLPDAAAAELVESLPEPEVKELLHRIDSERAAQIVTQLPSDEQADVIGKLDSQDAEKILDILPEATAEQARELIAYPPTSAGGLMVKEFLAYDDSLVAGDVIRDMRANAERYEHYDIQYAFVTSGDDELKGVLRLRDLLLSADIKPVSQMMIPKPYTVMADDDLDGLEKFFDDHEFFGVPVTNQEGQLLGVVRRTDVEEALAERVSRRFLSFMGIVGGEELRTMPLRQRSTRRLSWLSLNVFLNVIAASIIAFHQDTLEAVIALAVFLPIISDMSGCSGNQAVAVSMRELSLGLVRPTEVLRVAWKEGTVGIINGLALGLILGGLAFLWKGNIMLGVVVGAALALNTLMAVVLGGSIPLVLRFFKQDPALASGPILTTVTDMCGFFLVLSMASATLQWIT